jgi:hypothetical protein
LEGSILPRNVTDTSTVYHAHTPFVHAVFVSYTHKLSQQVTELADPSTSRLLSQKMSDAGQNQTHSPLVSFCATLADDLPVLDGEEVRLGFYNNIRKLVDLVA